MNETKVPENRAYKVILILLVGLAAFSTAMKDLNRLQGMLSSVQEFTIQWRGTDLAMLNVESNSIDESWLTDSPLIHSSAESGSSDCMAEKIDYEIIDEPEVGGKVDLVASKKAKRNLPHFARAKYAPARNLKEEISAKLRDGHWPVRFEYKTFDRAVTLELPMTMVNDIKADALETDVSPDFPLSPLSRINRKQSHGNTDNGRRDFMFKIVERNSSRRAS